MLGAPGAEHPEGLLGGTQRVNRPTGQSPGAFASHCGWALWVSDPGAGEGLRRPVLTGGEPFRWRGWCQRARHAEPHRLGWWRWPGGVTNHLAAAARSPERKEAAELGPYLDDGGCKRAQAKQGR